MSGDADWVILDRYFSGECSPEEAAAIVRWAARSDAHTQTLESARRVWAATGKGATPERFDVNAAWESVRGRLAEPAAAPAPGQLPSPAQVVPRRSSRHTPLRLTTTTPPRGVRRFVAPAAASLAAAAALLVWLHPALNITQTARPAREYSTIAGQRSTIELADGTRVMLNARSRLDVPAGYGEDTREVFLEGEAFFEVDHDAERPFLVHAGDAVAEDLGTAFVVRAYPEDSSLIVVVASGTVALRQSVEDARGVALTTGQLGRLDPSGLVTVANDVDLDRYLAWRQGTLAFRQTPFSEVVRELERWYGVEVTYDDTSLSAVPITASLTDLPAETALGILAQLLDVSYERDGSLVRLKPNGSPP